MKKILGIISAALLCPVLLCGCGGKSYENLTIVEGVKLGDEEEYAIAFRDGSDMVAKVDEITAQMFRDGTMKEIAGRYGLTASLVSEFKASGDVGGPAQESDWEYIKAKGTLVIGITNFKPMNYKDEKGEWTGFDTEYAETVAEELGVKPEFKQIYWENKDMELGTKSVDCLWNGMTVTDAIKKSADVTGAYINNYQALVVKDKKKYDSIEALEGKTVAAESGSAGESAVKADPLLSKTYKPVEDQNTALLQVKSGAAEACVIDYIMANYMLN